MTATVRTRTLGFNTRVASDDVPWSRVRTFGLPCTQNEISASGSRGSNQAPVGSCTTPARTSSVTRAAARQAPRSLDSRTRSPVVIPRGAASAGWTRPTSRPWILCARECAPKSSCECSRVAGWFATSQSGCRESGSSVGGSQTGWPGASAYPNAPIVAEASSIRPDGVGSGWASGSARKAPMIPPESATCGSSSSPAARNSSNDGAGSPRSANPLRVGSYSHSSQARASRPSVNAAPTPSRSASPVKIA